MDNVNFLPELYNWKSYPEMNVKIWEEHQNTPYLKGVTDLEKSHRDTMKLIDTFTDEELFTKKIFTLDWNN